MSEDVKTFVFPGNGMGSGALDPNLLLGMGGGYGGGMWNNPIWAIVFLAALRNGGIFGNNGWDGNGAHPCTTSQLTAIQETLNSNHGQTLLMDAIKGNSSSIHELATTIGCNQNAVIAAINSVQSAICNVGNQVGMGTAQVINAVQSGDTSIITALKDCCCQTQQNIIKMGYDNQISNLQQSQLIQNGFSQIGYASAEQTCQLKQNGNDNTNRIIAKLDQIEDSRKDREIASLTAALTAANSRAERAAELAPINKALADIQCKQVSTVTVPNPSAVAVPACVAYNAGLYGVGQFGLNGAGVFG